MALKYLIVNRSRVRNVRGEYILYRYTLQNYNNKLIRYHEKVVDHDSSSYLIKHIVITQTYVNRFQGHIDKMAKIKFWTPWTLKKYENEIINFTYFGQLQEVLNMFKYLDYNEVKGQKFIPELDPFGEENWEG
jgi:hypothetical protein